MTKDLKQQQKQILWVFPTWKKQTGSVGISTNKGVLNFVPTENCKAANWKDEGVFVVVFCQFQENVRTQSPSLEDGHEGSWR